MNPAEQLFRLSEINHCEAIARHLAEKMERLATVNLIPVSSLSHTKNDSAVLFFLKDAHRPEGWAKVFSAYEAASQNFDLGYDLIKTGQYYQVHKRLSLVYFNIKLLSFSFICTIVPTGKILNQKYSNL